MVTAHETCFLKLSVHFHKCNKKPLVPSKLLMIKAFVKFILRLKDTENWRNKIKNYMKQSSSSCFIYTASYNNIGNCHHLIKSYTDGKSNGMYRSHKSVVRWEVGEEQPIWERRLAGKETKSEEDKGVIKWKQGSRSEVSQVCANHCWLLQFVVGSQWRSTVRGWITSQQQEGTDTPGCVSEWEKFSTRDLSAFPQGTSLPTPVS